MTKCVQIVRVLATQQTGGLTIPEISAKPFYYVLWMLVRAVYRALGPTDSAAPKSYTSHADVRSAPVLGG